MAAVGWVAVMAMAPAEPPLAAPLVETVPPAETSTVLPAARSMTGPNNVTDPPCALETVPPAWAIPVGNEELWPVRKLLVQ